MTALADPYGALRVLSFRRFVASLLTMTVAAQIQAVVVGWLVYQITRDPLALGLIGLAEVVPYAGVAVVAGYIADRADRKRVTVMALGVLLASSIALFTFVLIDPSPSIVWPFYVIIGVCGLARSFLQVSRSALVAEVVPRELFPNAATWRSSTWQLGTVAGPALGGILFAAFGARVTFGLNIVLSLASLLAMTSVRHTPGSRMMAGTSVLRNLAEGVAFLRVNRVILAALSLDLAAVFFGGAVALMPVFAADILEVGPRGLGFLQGAPGAGAVMMALILAHRPPVKAAGRNLLIAVAVFGVSMIGFALSRSFALSVVLLFVSGAADNVSAVIRSIMIQVLVPPGMLGRVSAVNAVFVGSSNELGAFESGVAARLMGVVPSVVFGGLMTLTVVGVAAWRVPVLRNLREIRSRGDDPATNEPGGEGGPTPGVSVAAPRAP